MRSAALAVGTLVALDATSCSSERSMSDATCERETARAALAYPAPGSRNVSPAISRIVVSGSDGSSANLALVDSGGRRISVGPLAAAPRPYGAPRSASYETAVVNALAGETNYIVLYSPAGCDGAEDYAIGSFTTE